MNSGLQSTSTQKRWTVGAHNHNGNVSLIGSNCFYIAFYSIYVNFLKNKIKTEKEKRYTITSNETIGQKNNEKSVNSN